MSYLYFLDYLEAFVVNEHLMIVVSCVNYIIQQKLFDANQYQELTSWLNRVYLYLQRVIRVKRLIL